MTKSVTFSLLILAAGLQILSACSLKPLSQSKKFLIPYPDGKGGYSLQVVELKTLSSSHEVSGQAADVYYEPPMNSSGFTGSLAAPKLTLSGDVYVPKDEASGAALAVYAQFEKMYFWEKKVLLNSQMTWPRKVGIDLQVATTAGMRLFNNARYYDQIDAMGILPFQGNGLPLVLNAGVLAHEHFHAHFERLIEKPLGLQKSPVQSLYPKALWTSQELAEAKPSGACGLDDSNYFDIVVRGWNEGLADFYGAMFTESGEFMFPSGFTENSEFSGRRLDRSPTAMADEDRLHEALKQNSSQLSFQKCVGFGASYYNGTQMARVLYGMAQRNEFPSLGDDEGLDSYQRAARYVLWKLAQFSAPLGMQDRSTVTPQEMLVYLTKDLALSSETCKEISLAAPLQDPKGTYPQCGF